MSASGRTPARRRTSATRTPSQVAFPASVPPTSLETQVRVSVRSTSGRATRSRAAELDLAVDEAVHPQPPRGGVEPGHHQGGVDPVEVGGRGDPGGHAGDLDRGARRDRRRRLRGRRQPQRPRADPAAVAAGQRPAPRTREHGQPRGAADGEDDVAAGGPTAPGERLAAQRTTGEQQGHEPGGGPDDGGARREGVGAGPGDGGGPRHEAEEDDEHAAGHRTTPDEQPGGDREPRHDDRHRQQQRQLVVGAEGRDRGVLEPAGREVDEGLADGHERAGRGVAELGGDVGDRDGERTGGEPGERTGEAAGLPAGPRVGVLRLGRPLRRRHAPGSGRGPLRMGEDRFRWARDQPTSTETVCQPVAPSGAGGASTPVCGVPVPSVALTCRVCVPGAASQV